MQPFEALIIENAFLLYILEAGRDQSKSFVHDIKLQAPTVGKLSCNNVLLTFSPGRLFFLSPLIHFHFESQTAASVRFTSAFLHFSDRWRKMEL